MKRLFALVVLTLFVVSSASYAMPKVNVGGDLRFNYNYYKVAGTMDEFDFNDGTGTAAFARLKLSGDISDDVAFVLQTSAGSGFDILNDAYIDVKMMPVTLRMGSFKVPFGYDFEMAKTTLLPSYIVNTIISRRDLGMAVMGKCMKAPFTYEIAMLNGTGTNIGGETANQGKDFALRLVFDLPMATTLGVSGYYGQGTAAAQVQKVNYGAYVMGKVMTADVLLETVLGEAANGTTTINDTYLQVSKMIGKYEPLVKVDYYDADTTAASNAVTTITLGLNKYMADNAMMLINYNMVMEETTAVDNDTAQVQVRVEF